MNANHLIPYGSVFYTTSASFGPETIVNNGQLLFRYMDRIYIPSKPSHLKPNEVSDLSELRLLLRETVIENQYTQAVLDHLYRLATGGRGGLRMLDLGCGDGNIVPLMLSKPSPERPSEIVGVDVCPRAVAAAKERLENGNNPKLGTAVLVSRDQRIPLRSDYFSAAVANFVLHFPVSLREVGEVHRVLTPGGRLAYNDYRYESDPEHFRTVVATFEEAGFVTETSIVEFRQHLKDGFRNRRHGVVLCTKSCIG